MPHWLNGRDRTWPESNCAVDMWIGLLHGRGLDPRPVLGVAAGMGWEGDHFTFVKPCSGDLFALSGVVLHEMAVWHAVEDQMAGQVGAGRVPMPEVDSFFLPDTGDHGAAHSKTTIAITGIDCSGRQLDYVHNGGAYRLDGEDYAGVLGLPPHARTLFPYAEVARFLEPPGDVREAARVVLGRLRSMRGPEHPVRAFAAALPGLIARQGAAVHLLCFNTVRQLGAGFGLLAAHLEWLGEDGSAAARLAEQAKVFQFQLARAARRGRLDAAAEAALEEIAASWAAADVAIASAARLSPG